MIQTDTKLFKSEDNEDSEDNEENEDSEKPVQQTKENSVSIHQYIITIMTVNNSTMLLAPDNTIGAI